MKKLLLLSAIVLGASSIASAQAVDPAPAKATVAKNVKVTSVKEQKAMNAKADVKNKDVIATNKLIGARPSLTTNTVATKQKANIRKQKTAVPAKAN